MSNCNVTFWSDKDNQEGNDGEYRNFDGPQSVPDLEELDWENDDGDDMKDDTSWIDTASQAWVRIYSQPNYQGRTALIGPNQGVNLRNLKDENNEDDMNDTVGSFQIFDHKPDVNTSDIINNFVALYPGADRDRKDYKYEIEWYAQDSQYRIYDPSIQLTTDDKINFEINLDHIQLESDDHATVTFGMTLKGDFADRIQVTYDMGDATQIPDWAIKLIDGAIDVAEVAAIAIADGAEIILTDGVGVVATVETNKLIEYTAKGLTFCVDHLNTVLGAAFKFQDDGGTTNFPAIVSHSIARLILAYYQELYGSDSASLHFDQQNFFNKLGVSSWDESKNNPFVEFEHDSYSFRSYYPDNTFFYAKGGALSSVKIDAIDDFEKDDHLVLQAIHDPQGHLFSVAGGIDIFSVKNISNYTAPASGVLTYNSAGEIIHITQEGEKVTVVNNYNSLESAYADMMTNALKSTGSQYDIDITDRQTTLVDASVKVLEAISAAIQ